MITAYDNSLWEQPMGTAYGNSLWEQPMGTAYGNSLWALPIVPSIRSANFYFFYYFPSHESFTRAARNLERAARGLRLEPIQMEPATHANCESTILVFSHW